MAEQSSPEIKPKHALIKKSVKRMAPVIIAAVTALSPDSKASLPIPVVPVSIPSEQEQAEVEKTPFKPQVTVLDSGLSSPREGITQNEYFSNEDVAKRLLGSAYFSKEQLEREFGRPIKGLGRGEAAVTTGKYKQVLAHTFIENYFSHGDEVTQVMEGVWSKADLKNTGVELIPLQKILDVSSVKEIQDSLGNQGVSISFNHQRIIELLKNNTNRVVNMSFQVGDVDIFLKKKYISIPQPENIYSGYAVDSDEMGNIYIGAVGRVIDKDGKKINVDAQGEEVKPTTPDEQKALRRQKQEEANQKATIKETDSPSVEIVGAYHHDKALENLPKLFAIANVYPDKLFFAAAGNEGEDFEEALKELKDQKPKNLSIVGQWSGRAPSNKVLGADIYVNNRMLGIGDGSSFSTPVLTAYAEILFRQGLSQDEVLEKIKASSHQEEYSIDDTEGKTMVFDPAF